MTAKSLPIKNRSKVRTTFSAKKVLHFDNLIVTRKPSSTNKAKFKFKVLQKTRPLKKKKFQPY